MVRASRGLRSGTRRKLSRAFRSKFTVTPYLREFKEDDRVTINPNPSSHKGMPHIRFKGAAGIVLGKRGNAYMVEVKIGNKKKTITARPEHLVPVSI
jgi:large subunit ribosomal protein L21e